jgi:hypothetical protein
MSIVLSGTGIGRPFGRSLVVFRGGYEFAEFPVVPDKLRAGPRDSTTLLADDGRPAIKLKRSPTPDGSLEVRARVRGESGAWSRCGGQTYAVVALLDGHPAATVGGTSYLRLSSDTDRIDFVTRFAALPTSPGHRLELLLVPGLGRPFEYPVGTSTPWKAENPVGFGKVEW